MASGVATWVRQPLLLPCARRGRGNGHLSGAASGYDGASPRSPARTFAAFIGDASLQRVRGQEAPLASAEADPHLRVAVARGGGVQIGRRRGAVVARMEAFEFLCIDATPPVEEEVAAALAPALVAALEVLSEAKQAPMEAVAAVAPAQAAAAVAEEKWLLSDDDESDDDLGQSCFGHVPSLRPGQQTREEVEALTVGLASATEELTRASSSSSAGPDLIEC